MYTICMEPLTCICMLVCFSPTYLSIHIYFSLSHSLCLSIHILSVEKQLIQYVFKICTNRDNQNHAQLHMYCAYKKEQCVYIGH